MLLWTTPAVLAAFLASFLFCRVVNSNDAFGALENAREKTVYDSDSCPFVNPKYPVLLPHPDDCSKFYICDSGSRYLKECQPGLHFNPNVNACDYPKRARCEKDFPTDEVTNPKGKVGDDTYLCPVENSAHPVLLPHPTDCNKFYICDGGSAHLKTCHQGLHFNSKIKACDYPKNVGCDVDEMKIPKGKVSDDTHMCPAENPSYPIFLPHPNDCNKFYTCDNGLARLQSCQPGLHYNPKAKACDYPINAGCEVEIMFGAPGIDSPFCPLRNGKIPIFFRHETNCSVYYMCGNGLAYEFVCPARLHFNLRKRVCDYEKDADCRNDSS